MDKKTFEQKIWNIVYSDDGNEKRLIDLLWGEIKPDLKAIQVEAKVKVNFAEEKEKFMNANFVDDWKTKMEEDTEEATNFRMTKMIIDRAFILFEKLSKISA